MNYKLEDMRDQGSQRRPQVSSYDSGHEHSIEHLIELRMMLEASDEDDDKDVSDRCTMAVCA